MDIENEEDVRLIADEMKTAVANKQITDQKDMILLNLALQVKTNYFLITNLISAGFGESLMVMMGGDYDPEEEHLKQLYEEELDDVKDGNVVRMDIFKGKES